MSRDPNWPDHAEAAADKQRQQPAATLDATPELIQQITAVAPSLVYMFDIQTGQRIWQNNWLPSQLGHADPGDVPTYEFMERVVHPEDRERLAAHRRKMAWQADHVVSEIEYRARHVDGTWRWILSRNLVFSRNPDGSVRCVIGSSTDITGVKRADEELRQLNVELERRVMERTADLAMANRELEAFVYSISHDLRAPLRAIDGFTAKTMQGCCEQLNAEARRDLSRVRAAAQRMAGMIDSLLALSRTARSEFSPQRVDLAELARAAVSELRQTEPDRRVEVVLVEHARVTGDPRLLRILLDNLIGNAWKFTAKREQARIEFGTRMENAERIYFVRDNGAGFDITNATALFAPFHRFHRMDEFAGTGIGLATVLRIVQRHGGRIWAESAPDQGATFYFTLPCRGVDRS